MEHIFTVSPALRQYLKGLKDEGALNVAVSSRNTIAFTSTHKLDARSNVPQYQKVYFLYVCDVDKPWDVYAVTQCDEEITHLCWHVGGTQLLITTAAGSVQLWSMKDYVLDKWECINATLLPMEEIMAISWLHTCTQVSYNVDKKDLTLYTDKIVPARFVPSLTQFGGKATGGWIAVTHSGLVCVGVICLSSSGVKVNLQSVPLLASSAPHHVAKADIGFSRSGEVIVATSDGLPTSTIHCYTIVMKTVGESCEIFSKSRGGFFLRCHADFKDSSSSRITHIKFTFPEDPNCLLVDATNGCNSCSEVWQLQEQPVKLHRIFQTSGDAHPASVHTWWHKTSLTHPNVLTAVAPTRLPVMQSYAESYQIPLQCLALSYRDGGVKLVHRHTLQVLLSHVIKPKPLETSHGEKRVKSTPFVVSSQLSLTGSCLVTLDNQGALSLFTTVSAKEPATALNSLLPLIEYCLYTGYDWWDILFTLKPSVVDSMVQRLHDNHAKQTPLLQSLTFCRLMAATSSLYHLLGASLPKAADTRCKLLLHSVYQIFHSMLAPKMVTSQQKQSAGDQLSQLCSHNMECDLKKLLMTLDHTEYHIDATTIQSMQHLIQWVGDFTLYLLATLPTFQAYPSLPGATIVRDTNCLSMLRELLVMIRINTSALPAFTCSVAHQDTVAVLFKLLTKLWQTVRDGNNMELEDLFLDECCIIPGTVFVPTVDQCLITDCSTQPSIVHQYHPVTCLFGDMPKHLARGTSIQYVTDTTTQSHQKRDMLRQISVGKTCVADMRRCTRCGLTSLLKAPLSTPLSLSWDKRWAKVCLCGGLWVSLSQQVES